MPLGSILVKCAAIVGITAIATAVAAAAAAAATAAAAAATAAAAAATATAAAVGNTKWQDHEETCNVQHALHSLIRSERIRVLRTSTNKNNTSN